MRSARARRRRATLALHEKTVLAQIAPAFRTEAEQRVYCAPVAARDPARDLTLLTRKT
jgi:hypothetical protein